MSSLCNLITHTYITYPHTYDDRISIFLLLLLLLILKLKILELEKKNTFFFFWLRWLPLGEPYFPITKTKTPGFGRRRRRRRRLKKQRRWNRHERTPFLIGHEPNSPPVAFHFDAMRWLTYVYTCTGNITQSYTSYPHSHTGTCWGWREGYPALSIMGK